MWSLYVSVSFIELSHIFQIETKKQNLKAHYLQNDLQKVDAQFCTYCHLVEDPLITLPFISYTVAV